MIQLFETTVTYDKTFEDGTIKKTKERFIVEALSFAEAEAVTSEKRAPYISGEYDVCAAKKTHIAEVINAESERYYLARIAISVYNEKTMAVKKAIVKILVGASSFKEACKNLVADMEGINADWEIVSLAGTPIVEVYLQRT